MSEKEKTKLLTPENIQLLIGSATALIAAAPQAINIVTKLKDLVATMFSAKIITVAQQDALFAHVESLAALARAGVPPSHWQVRPDPGTPPVVAAIGDRGESGNEEPRSPIAATT